MAVPPLRTAGAKARMGARKGQPQETPRTVLDKTRRKISRKTLHLVMTLDAQQIESIREDFYKRGKSVNLPEFVEIMKKHLRQDSKDSPELLVQSLVELFDSMDLDGNHDLEFDEFLSTVVHVGMGHADHLILNPIKNYHEGPHLRTCERSTNQTVKYVREINRLMISEPLNAVVKFYEPGSLKASRVVDVKRSGTLATEYIHSNARKEVFDIVAVSTSQSIHLWERAFASGKPTLRESVVTDQPQTCLKWIPERNLLFSGDMVGDVHAWYVPFKGGEAQVIDSNLGEDSSMDILAAPRGHSVDRPSLLNHRTEEVKLFPGHTDVVTSITMSSSIDDLLTGSLDGTIRLWDLARAEPKFRFVGHRAGVVDLVYSPEYRFVFSASIDHDVGVWSPFATKQVTKLTGHSAPLIGVSCVPGTPQVISADSDGWVKIWDTRNFACMQTLRSKFGTHIQSFSTSDEHQRIVTAGPRDIQIFDQEDGPYSKHNDADPAFCCLFNHTSLSFVTASRRAVKVYNGLTGQVNRVFRRLCWSEITAVCLDKRQRKLIVGEHNGQITVFNYLTGAHMKNLTEHADEISYLGYVEELQYVISVGRDHVIRVHDETPIEELVLIHEITLPDAHRGASIVNVAFSFDLSLIAAAADNGYIYMWDMESARLVDVCEAKQSQVTAMCFLAKYPLLASADEAGNTTLWNTRPSKFKATAALTFQNVSEYTANVEDDGTDDESSPRYGRGGSRKGSRAKSKHAEPAKLTEGCMVTTLAFDSEQDLLFTGDILGRVQGWSLRSWLLKIGQKKLDLDSYGKEFFSTGRRQSQLAMYAKMLEQNGDHQSGEHLVLSGKDIVPAIILHTPGAQVIRDIHILESPATTVVTSEAHNAPVTLWSSDLHSSSRYHAGTLLGAIGGIHVAKAPLDNNDPFGFDETQSLRKEEKVLEAPWLFTLDVKAIQRKQSMITHDVLEVVKGRQPASILEKWDMVEPMTEAQKALVEHKQHTKEIEDEEDDGTTSIVLKTKRSSSDRDARSSFDPSDDVVAAETKAMTGGADNRTKLMKRIQAEKKRQELADQLVNRLNKIERKMRHDARVRLVEMQRQARMFEREHDLLGGLSSTVAGGKHPSQGGSKAGLAQTWSKGKSQSRRGQFSRGLSRTQASAAGSSSDNSSDESGADGSDGEGSENDDGQGVVQRSSMLNLFQLRDLAAQEMKGQKEDGGVPGAAAQVPPPGQSMNNKRQEKGKSKRKKKKKKKRLGKGARDANRLRRLKQTASMDFAEALRLVTGRQDHAQDAENPARSFQASHMLPMNRPAQRAFRSHGFPLSRGTRLYRRQVAGSWRPPHTASLGGSLRRPASSFADAQGSRPGRRRANRSMSRQDRLTRSTPTLPPVRRSSAQGPLSRSTFREHTFSRAGRAREI